MEKGIYDKISEIIIDALATSFVKHGHFMTGKIIDDIEIKIQQAADGTNLDYYMYPYGGYLERGVKAENIPFSPGSGAKTSMYISALISYVKRKFSVSDAKEAKSIAFAIAHTQKRHGMPAVTGGQGTKWISDAIETAEKKFDSLADEHYRYAEEAIENMIIKLNF
jgi:hypothetical protein